MNAILKKYDAVRSRHRLPRLAPAEVSLARVQGLSSAEVAALVERCKPSAGWCATVGAAVGISAFADRFCVPAKGAMLEGEFWNGVASLWTTADGDSMSVTMLSEDRSFLEGLVDSDRLIAPRPVLRESMTFAATEAVKSSTGCDAALYHVYWDIAPQWTPEDLAQRLRRRWQAFAGFGFLNEPKEADNG